MLTLTILRRGVAKEADSTRSAVEPGGVEATVEAHSGRRVTLLCVPVTVTTRTCTTALDLRVAVKKWLASLKKGKKREV